MEQAHLLRILDRMLARDWETACLELGCDGDPVANLLHALLTRRQREDREVQRIADGIQHEMGNALAIAIANLEGMIDGVLPSETERFEDVRDALQSIASLLDRWKKGVHKAPQ
jgi:hypothetical protein